MLKRAALSLYAGLLFALLFAALFAVLQAEHDCTHDDACPVCLHLRGALDLLKDLGPAHLRLMAAAAFFGSAALCSKLCFLPFAAPTSVSLKIRMNT
jgi:hypothetical protein